MADLSTLPRLLLRNAREMPQRTALREKDRGIWQAWTWRQYHDHVRDFALGLAALGFTRGDKLSVKTATGEFSAPLTELHDAWWNSIARAMA